MGKSPDQSSSIPHFEGFSSPNYTQVPDQLLDNFLHILTGAELKVILYIVRRTFGFKKDTDNISLNQMLNGIITKEGERLDWGTGLSKPTLLKALKSLKARGLIVSQRRHSEEKGDEATQYRLRMKGDVVTDEGHTPVVKKVYQGGGKESLPGRGKETLPHNKQKTINSKTTTKKQSQPKSENKSNNSDGADTKTVVVALTRFGLSKKVAQEFASRHPQGWLLEKVDFLEYKLATEPVTSPAGMLRKMIADDWAAPAGYTKTWRDKLQAEAEQEAQQKQALEDAQRLAEAHEQQLDEVAQEAATARAKRREAIIKTHRVPQQLVDLWDVASDDLKRQNPFWGKLLDTHISILKSVSDGVATVGIDNPAAVQVLQRRYGQKLQEALNRQLDGQKVERIEFETLETATP